MKINMDNYEAFFLDYVEGRLDDSSVLEMLAFLRKHPELKEELECFGEMKLEPVQVVFKDKELLKKLNFTSSEVTHRNFEDFCIAYYEKELSQNDSEKLQEFLKNHPDKKKDFHLYGEVFLKVDKSIVFEGKSFLKKRIKTKTGIIILRWTAVAAGLILAVSVFYKSPVKNIHPEREMPAVVQNQKSSNVVPDNNSNKNSESQPENINPPKTAPSAFKNKVQVAISVPDNTEPTTSKDMGITPEIEMAYIQPIEIERVSNRNIEKTPDPVISSSTPVYALNDNSDLELFELAEKVIKKRIFKSEPENPSRKISLWDIADVTLKSYNRIAENDIILHRKTDENGKITALAVETENRRYGSKD